MCNMSHGFHRVLSCNQPVSSSDDHVNKPRDKGTGTCSPLRWSPFAFSGNLRCLKNSSVQFLHIAPSHSNFLSSRLSPSIMFSRVLAPLAAILSHSVVSGGPTVLDVFPRTPAAGIDVQAIASQLSANAKIYLPGTNEFTTYTTRWSNLEAPTPSVVIAPGTEKDVQHIVSWLPMSAGLGF